MTDKQFLRAIRKAVIAANEARLAIDVAENEYVRRFGVHPSDIDNDGWIDTVQYGNGLYTNIQQVIDDHNLHLK